MDELLGKDILLVDRDFSTLPTGDIETVSGRKCLQQDLAHRLATPRGSLPWRPAFGLSLQRFIQADMTDVDLADLVQEIQVEAERDPRVEPGSAQATVLAHDMDSVQIRLQVLPIASTHPLNLVLLFDPRTGAVEVPRGNA
jgi:phage baseplate assembly protein W